MFPPPNILVANQNFLMSVQGLLERSIRGISGELPLLAHAHGAEGKADTEMPLIVAAESQGLEQHQAQSGCSRSSHRGYTLQTPPGVLPGPTPCLPAPWKTFGPSLQGTLVLGEGISHGQVKTQGARPRPSQISGN